MKIADEKNTRHVYILGKKYKQTSSLFLLAIENLLMMHFESIITFYHRWKPTVVIRLLSRRNQPWVSDDAHFMCNNRNELEVCLYFFPNI